MDILGDSEILLGTYEAFVLGYKLAEDAVRSGQSTTQLSVSTVVSRFSGLDPSLPKCPLNRYSPLNGIILIWWT